ncbi:MAG: response regulator [Arcobacteraceae bacterium]|nr:response regulator [Arcobacteraceae bacterium]
MINLKVFKDLAKEFTVLYVEDEDKLRQKVSAYLKRFFLKVDTAKDGQDGLDRYKEKQYDLVLTDIKMPKLNGLDMAAEIKAINEYQNILIISAYSDISNFTTSIKLGIDGYIIKPIHFDQLNTTLYKILYKLKKFRENVEYKNNLEKLVEEKTMETRQLQEEKIKNYQKTLYALVKMIEDRDIYTGGHSQRVASYSKMIAVELGLDENICENIYQAGILHDIGKIAIPDTILLKPSALDEVEYKLIQEHVSMGVDILSQVPMFDELIPYIEEHHERFDGSGYPKGLKGDEMLLESQIMGISDTFDAMTTSRIYKAKKSVNQALEEIQSLKGIYFRNDVTEAALKVLSKIVLDDNIDQLPTTKLEEERFSYFYKDQITNSYNASYLDLVLNKNRYEVKYKYINFISVHNLDNINSKYGWEEGNKYLKNVSLNLQNIYGDVLIFRIHSDDFLILSKSDILIDENELKKFICRDGLIFEVKKYEIIKNKLFSFSDFESSR